MIERSRQPSAWRLAGLLIGAFLVSGCEDKVAEPSPAPPLKPSVAPPEASSAAPASASAAAEPAAEEAEPESIAAQHVLVAYRGAKRAPNDVKRSKAEARKRAEEVHAKATGGADFSELAEEYSDDPGGKANRGNLGKFKREAMVKRFSDAAFELKVGEISEPVETEFGFHIIKRNQ